MNIAVNPHGLKDHHSKKMVAKQKALLKTKRNKAKTASKGHSKKPRNKGRKSGRKPVIASFDSTRGYPGEGPSGGKKGPVNANGNPVQTPSCSSAAPTQPKAGKPHKLKHSRKTKLKPHLRKPKKLPRFVCKICGKQGHTAANHKTKKSPQSLVVGQTPILSDIKDLTTAQAISKVKPSTNDNGDHPAHGGTTGPHPHIPEGHKKGTAFPHSSWCPNQSETCTQCTIPKAPKLPEEFEGVKHRLTGLARLLQLQKEAEQKSLEQAEELKAIQAKEAHTQHILLKMRAKASERFRVTDLDSESDHRVTLRMLHGIARHEKLYDDVPHSEELVEAVYNEEVLAARKRRLTTALTLRVDPYHNSFLTSFFLGLSGHVIEPPTCLRAHQNPLAELQEAESHAPWTRVLLHLPHYLCATSALAFRTFALALGEELLKRALEGLLLTVFREGIHETTRLMPGPTINMKVLGTTTHCAGARVWTTPTVKTVRVPSRYVVPPVVKLTVRVLSRILPSAALSAYEARADLTREFIPRFAAHLALSSLGVRKATAIHGSWNLYSLMTGQAAQQLYVRRDEAPPAATVRGSTYGEMSLNAIQDVCHGDYLSKVVRTQSEFKYKEGDFECVPKFGIRPHFGVLGVTPRVSRQCSCNERIALRGRVGKELPMHVNPDTEEAVLKHWKTLSDYIWPLLSKTDRVEHPVSREEWLATFPNAKRMSFTRLMVEGVEQPEPHIVDAFVKREKALSIDAMMFMCLLKDCRWIQGCHPTMSIECGRHVRKLSKNVAEQLSPHDYTSAEIREGKHFVYTSGMSAETIGQHLTKAFNLIQSMCDGDEVPVWVEDDESRFDLHLTKGPFMFLHRVYGQLLRKRIAKTLRRDISKGRSKLGGRYSVPYTMQSGLPDTSTGDNLVNTALKAWYHRIGRKWITVVCGDDSLTVTTDKELAFLDQFHDGTPEKVYADAGMEIEFKASPDYLDVEFCSARLMLDHATSTFLLVPKTGKLLARIGWDMKDRPPEESRRWLRGIGETLARMEHDMILHALGLRILEETVGVHPLIESNPYKLHFAGTSTCDLDGQLEYLAHHYGLCESETNLILTYLKEGPIFDQKMDHPLIMDMAERDA